MDIASVQDLRRAFAAGDFRAVWRVNRQLFEGADLEISTWYEVVRIAEAVGDDGGAAIASRRLLSKRPGDAALTLLCAQLHDRVGRTAEVEPLFNAAIDTCGDFVEAYIGRAMARAHLGDFTHAREDIERALSLQPGNAHAWSLMAQITNLAVGGQAYLSMKDAYSRLCDNDLLEKAAFAFALARSHVSEEDDEGAAYWLERANRNKRTATGYGGDQSDRFAEQIMRAFSAQFMESMSPDESPESRFAFVLGAPRSGTTLLESLISKRTGAVAGGELRALGLAAHPLGMGAAGPAAAFFERTKNPAVANRLWTDIRKTYARCLEEMFGDFDLITDKQTNNITLAGAIRLSMPRSPVFVVERDLLDTAWSCWRMNFAVGNTWSFDADGIAGYLTNYKRLIAHWRVVSPGCLHMAAYEDVAANPMLAIETLLKAADLPDRGDDESAGRTRSSVRTASMAQIRGPVVARYVGAARRFPKATKPLVRALEARGAL